MKNRIITFLIYILSGVLYLIGPHTIFKVCSAKEMVMTCHWSVQAETGLGILLLLTGVFYLFAKGKEAKIFLSLQTIGSYVVGILIPAFLIGGCKSKDMACQSLTYPSLYLISILGILYSIGNLVFFHLAKKAESLQETS
ncbi:DUF4418 family protein [Anaerocolumna xylanovorans]|uniref:DUF4418 domain-containing protein n=1 Tax=Anaerocolumna xylanovorans DSM 12503 TaxID=1121345 RepID=A0A1M7Y249_9FIRM|nr:DUF4418 family protein [Anaerocolumna xylanovorans]SHO45965.1 protein of unknown function [Anaerocolumna xylanovorans DSM 12503]